MTPSRAAVAAALHSVFGEGRPVLEAWDKGLKGEEGPFAQALLGLCLRRWGRLNAWITPRLADPSRSLPLGTRIALAQGLASLAWLPGVATHAAVNEAVVLVEDRPLGFPPHKGMVNALLRKASKDRDALRAELEAFPSALDRPGRTDDLLKAALAPHGCEGELEHLWTHLQQVPRPAFLALDGAPLPEGLVPDPTVAGALHLEEGSAFPRPWLKAGHGMVQDRSSQALMAFQWEGKPGRIADLCAAPGGKTTALGKRYPEA